MDLSNLIEEYNPSEIIEITSKYPGIKILGKIDASPLRAMPIKRPKIKLSKDFSDRIIGCKVGHQNKDIDFYINLKNHSAVVSSLLQFQLSPNQCVRPIHVWTNASEPQLAKAFCAIRNQLKRPQFLNALETFTESFDKLQSESEKGYLPIYLDYEAAEIPLLDGKKYRIALDNDACRFVELMEPAAVIKDDELKKAYIISKVTEIERLEYLNGILRKELEVVKRKAKNFYKQQMLEYAITSLGKKIEFLKHGRFEAKELEKRIIWY